MKSLALASLLSLLALGCGTIQVDDITVMETDYLRSRNIVLRLATEELACPQEELTTKVLGVTVHANIKHLQVAGCGQKVVYIRTPDDGFALRGTEH